MTQPDTTTQGNSIYALTAHIKSIACDLGFELVGITTPVTPPHINTYDQWLSVGHHASMAYLATDRARERRTDPFIIMPAAKSILVLGFRYPNPAALPETTPRIASYAWGDDYHLIIPDLLTSLIEQLELHIGYHVEHRIYTDTGPILEREFAQRAGLGWIGKNTCLIHPKKGSYFLLAEVFLDLALTPDSPFQTDHCGTCTRCIDACPTQCILPTRTLDANRCISFLTIENKGDIPIHLRPLIDDWAFGCDICQQVCPWNLRFADNDHLSGLQPCVDFPPEYKEDVLLSPQGFNKKYKEHPFKRAKRRGYLRNLAVAMGNSEDPVMIPHLTILLQDFEPLVRRHAAWALGQIGGLTAANLLSSANNSEVDPSVQAEITLALKDLE